MNESYKFYGVFYGQLNFVERVVNFHAFDESSVEEK
jgi:hypothetical protein